MVQHLTVVDHPLVQHKLTLMRKQTTSTVEFRQLLREISQFLAYEITRNLPMTTRRIETPIEENVKNEDVEVTMCSAHTGRKSLNTQRFPLFFVRSN